MNDDSKLLRLKEMQEAIDESIKNIDEVVNQQQLLIEVVSESKEADTFKVFLSDSEGQIQRLVEQRRELIRKYDLLGSCIEQMEINPDIQGFAYDFMDVFKIFND